MLLFIHGTQIHKHSVFESGIRGVETVGRERHGLLAEGIHRHQIKVLDQSRHGITVDAVHIVLFHVPGEHPDVVRALSVERAKGPLRQSLC